MKVNPSHDIMRINLSNICKLLEITPGLEHRLHRVLWFLEGTSENVIFSWLTTNNKTLYFKGGRGECNWCSGSSLGLNLQTR